MIGVIGAIALAAAGAHWPALLIGWRHRRGLNRRRRVRCRGAETASSRPRERMTIGWARVRKDTPAAALRSPCADPLGAGGRVVSRRLVRTSMAGGRRDTLRALEIASG